jgi:hypothetical protein
MDRVARRKPMLITCPRCGADQMEIVEAQGQEPSFTCNSCGELSALVDLVPQLQALRDKVPFTLDESPRHAALVGSIAAASSRTDDELCEVASLLLQSPVWHARSAYYAIVSSKARIDMVRALRTHMLGADQFLDSLNALLDEAEGLAQMRNTYVHALWAHSTRDGSVYLLEHAGSVSAGQYRRVQESELEKVLGDLKALAKKLRDFAIAYGAAHPVISDARSMPDAVQRIFALLRTDER